MTTPTDAEAVEEACGNLAGIADVLRSIKYDGDAEGLDAAAALIRALLRERDDADEYLDRLLKTVSPGIVPLPDLLGKCTQADHLLATKRASALEEAAAEAIKHAHARKDFGHCDAVQALIALQGNLLALAAQARQDSAA